MTDYISRADAIEAVCGKCSTETRMECALNGYFCCDRRELEALPSADAIEFDFSKYQPRVRNKVNDGTPSADVSRIEYDDRVELSVSSRHKDKVILKDAFGSMEYVPSAEAVHGEWQYRATDEGRMYRKCSQCGWQQTYEDNRFRGHIYNFCPSCGARMKGGAV